MVEVRQMLDDWDYQNHMDSSPAALFEVFRKQLLALTFQDDLPEDYWFNGGSRSTTILQSLITLPDSPWWDNRSTPQVEARDQIFAQAFAQAVVELEGALGKDPARWAWGDLHLADFRNQTLGESGIPPIEALFNRGGFRASGGGSIVNATAFAGSENSYFVSDLPSMRMVLDFSDLGNSIAVHTTGQSGHAYHPHYIDMADLWRNIQYHPMLWEKSAIEAGIGGHLRLVPEG
jgi:penicillin amidase